MIVMPMQLQCHSITTSDTASLVPRPSRGTPGYEAMILRSVLGMFGSGNKTSLDVRVL